MAEPLVSIRNLSVRYRSRDEDAYALDQVSFDIERGRVYALVGESGSGKTTVGMSIVNLLPRRGGHPDRGRRVRPSAHIRHERTGPP